MKHGLIEAEKPSSMLPKPKTFGYVPAKTFN